MFAIKNLFSSPIGARLSLQNAELLFSQVSNVQAAEFEEFKSEWLIEGEPVKDAQESITGDREAVGGEFYIEWKLGMMKL